MNDNNNSNSNKNKHKSDGSFCNCVECRIIDLSELTYNGFEYVFSIDTSMLHLKDSANDL